ncbi:hypothetical protein FB446DRAFT_752584 [Lentinula raphanica]|nr:hypothetical protein FB446DRAFT_752584 [Lentinula raphanica]
MSKSDKSSSASKIPETDVELAKKYSLTESESNRLAKFESKQRNFEEWLTTQKLDPVETTAISCKSFDDVATFWSDMSKNTQSNFNLSHQSGWRLWVKRYQNFSKGASAFMEDLGPLLDIVSDMGVPYTGIAIGIINGLLTFAGRKNTMEHEISSAIEGIKDRLPGLKMYQVIYTGSHELETDLQKKVLFVYIAFVDMSMDIVKYFLQPGYRRWGTALFKSGKFTDMTTNIYDLLSNIRYRCEELVGLRIDILVHGMADLKIQNKNLQAKIEELQQDRSTAHLLEIQNSLGLSSWTHEYLHKKLSEYKSRLLYECHEEGIYQQMTGAEIKSLQASDVFIKWEKPKSSGILILRGINNENLSEGKIHNWVSPFVLDMVDNLYGNGSNAIPLGVHVFDSVDSTSRSIFEALSRVLFQLLWFKRSELTGSNAKKYEPLMAALHEYIHCSFSESNDNKIQALGNLASQIVQMYNEESESVYVLLDRVDQCNDHYELMNILVNRMMKEASCSFKIILVAGINWPSLEYLGLKHVENIHEIVMVQDFLDYNEY